MAAPSIDDAVGEFIEIANADIVRVNLQGWRLVDKRNRSHVIATELWIEPGAYLVLTRGAVDKLAGYVHSDYQFYSLQLVNTDGKLSLFAPNSAVDAQPVDEFTWDKASPGASFERTDLLDNNWVVATTPWSATHIDKGSPGAAFVAPPTPTPTPTSGPAPLLRLSEIMAAPSIDDAVGEFIEIANVDAVRVNLQGWRLVDGGNHSHVIATDLWIEPGAYRVLTKGTPSHLPIIFIRIINFLCCSLPIPMAPFHSLRRAILPTLSLWMLLPGAAPVCAYKPAPASSAPT
ncbi:MAG: lamin tail domain-containing protein [Anaerolineales bacterium]|nr:lamin tail domain-containing protein [Anaerolineales bacterium]